MTTKEKKIAKQIYYFVWLCLFILAFRGLKTGLAEIKGFENNILTGEVEKEINHDSNSI